MFAARSLLIILVSLVVFASKMHFHLVVFIVFIIGLVFSASISEVLYMKLIDFSGKRFTGVRGGRVC